MSGGARRSRAPSGPPTVGSAPFGPLPESLWRSLAGHARAYEDEGVALALVSLTVDLGWPENGTHVRYLLASVAEEKRFKRRMHRDATIPQERAAWADDVAELSRWETELRGVVTRRGAPAPGSSTASDAATDGPAQ